MELKHSPYNPSQMTQCDSSPPVVFLGPHLQFQDEVAALRVQVDHLTSMGVNKIIALGHAGFAVDKDIAKRVKGVDVVIGGHSNTFLYTGRPISIYCTPLCPIRFSGITCLHIFTVFLYKCLYPIHAYDFTDFEFIVWLLVVIGDISL